MPWATIFLVLAFILFGLAAINVPSPKVQLGWAGMASLVVYWFIT